MSERTPLRAIRTGAFASVCVAVSVGGHAASSGQGVPPLGLLLGALVILGSAWVLTGRERRWGAITGWMLWGQLALHLVFSLTASAGHGHDEALAPVLDGGAGMPAGHLVAAMVCAWWLRQGESTLFAYLRSLTAAFFPLFPPLAVRVPADPPRPRPLDRPVPVPTAPYLRHSLALRAPPLSPGTR
ncbi:hypothetical protein [Nocardiopsis lambiniae]|uniref:MFS transporter n=1 Tax=Nocardiopsis lambiniae TaxID=3075539 RepID=A0ABU2MFM9_9ACTN|nr:hypothetical protein [Nocardiopsis sp. DSM 44743]MDT0330681.1 hypothetical protein [Nocardiopsis sp. DSM 44743]